MEKQSSKPAEDNQNFETFQTLIVRDLRIINSPLTAVPAGHKQEIYPWWKSSWVLHQWPFHLCHSILMGTLYPSDTVVKGMG